MPQFPLNSCQIVSGVPRAISCVGALVFLSVGYLPCSSALTLWGECLIKANCSWRHSCYWLLPRRPMSVLSFLGVGLSLLASLLRGPSSIIICTQLATFWALDIPPRFDWIWWKISELSFPPPVAHWATTRLFSLILTSNGSCMQTDSVMLAKWAFKTWQNPRMNKA